MSPLKGKQRKDFYKSATKNNIIKRAGTPEEVAKALLFAVENEFITGTTIDVDGGWILA
jgi:NAD(P)-dependent dehydrogenase (short-subunit alcohol dehydrogenase family)